MKRYPMMLQLTLILFCVMAVPTAILTWYSGKEIMTNSESAIGESSLAGLNASRELNEKALNSLAQDVVRLTASKIFDRIRNFETYAKLSADYNDMSTALSVLRELVNLNRRGDGVYSSYFLLEGGDYVVSTDKGITKLERYEPTGWIEEALTGRRGIGGVWYPRRMSSGVHVISYVLPLNRLSTTTRGTIVVNVQESQIGNYLRSSKQGEQGYMLMKPDGTIISHNDKALLLTNGSELPHLQGILQSPSKEGYAFHELEGERLLYTWTRSRAFGWWNINIYSMDELMTKTHTMQRSIFWITAIIIFAGTVLSVFLATWLSKPLRKLVRAVRERGSLSVTNQNELVFLDAAFRRMQEEEEGLYALLQERQQDARSLAIHRLLRGEVAKEIAEMLPERYYTVAVVSIDRYRQYVSKSNPETRSYHRYLLTSKCESSFPDGIAARCVYQGEGSFAIVINFGQAELEKGFDGMNGAFVQIRDAALEWLGHSVTIGVSGRGESGSMVSEQLAEATEVIKRRMIEGSGCIFFSKEEIDRDKKYIYPAHSESKIMNFLDLVDLDSIFQELDNIRSEIHSVESISYDNILFIYNQLAGVTIKHLREKNVSTSRIFAGRGNIYSAIASLDTLDELEDYLREFFSEIVQYLVRHPVEINHGERIIRYLEEHFCEEIVFEEMAKEIGISYSYMRKIVFDLTGKSLIDYTNHLRIQKAKQLLLNSDRTIMQIASEVGYFNVQSLNRFFRKYEGMPPSSYKALKSRTS
ncbi:helix-turn-helix domain-containing protein [Paenibacillus sp. N4]|uniref:AraC family transcriptional regulator n=1 Tax=Paenibacillus vietnamensis TaxID=2590547 RepID=UPI001CD12F79|nr:AraC family transcriptional regulator [Paenibacillus vietnamensis]MCA0757827.1 helix-turn-helix domain-containing protein [Paenibacillus vietnamensis]